MVKSPPEEKSVPYWRKLTEAELKIQELEAKAQELEEKEKYWVEERDYVLAESRQDSQRKKRHV